MNEIIKSRTEIKSPDRTLFQLFQTEHSRKYLLKTFSLDE